MVPQSERDEVIRQVSETEEAKEGFRKKQQEAKRLARLDGETGQELVAHDKTERRAKRKSRRRGKADAWTERGDKLHGRMHAHLEAYEGRLRQLGQDDANPVGVAPLVWGTAQAIMADATGHTARIKLASLPRRQARLIMRAALQPSPYEGRRARIGRELRSCDKDQLDGPSRWWAEPGTRRWCHPAAIRTVAVGVALWHMRRRTSRRGFAGVVRGIPRRMLCAIAADGLTGVRPSLSALFGNMEGVPGAVRALGECGFVRIQQPPGIKVRSCDRGPSGFAFNVYWFYASPDAVQGLENPGAEVDALRDASLRYQLGLVERGPPAAAG